MLRLKYRLLFAGGIFFFLGLGIYFLVKCKGPLYIVTNNDLKGFEGEA